MTPHHFFFFFLCTANAAGTGPTYALLLYPDYSGNQLTSLCPSQTQVVCSFQITDYFRFVFVCLLGDICTLCVWLGCQDADVQHLQHDRWPPPMPSPRRKARNSLSLHIQHNISPLLFKVLYYTAVCTGLVCLLKIQPQHMIEAVLKILSCSAISVHFILPTLTSHRFFQ